MNKDDILARSRAEHQGSDEYEKQVLEKAGRLSAQVGLAVCCVIAAASIALEQTLTNHACWVIYFSIHATLFWTKYRSLRRRHELILALVSSAIGLQFAVLFVLGLARTLHG